MPNKLLDMMYAPRFQDGGALTPQEIERLNKLKRASQLTGYGEGPGMRAFQEMGDVGRGLLGAEAIIPGGEGYRTGQALANMPAVGVAAVPGKVASALPEVVTGLGALGAAGVIKPKGGNWLAGSVERAIEPLKRPLYPGRLPFGNDAQAIAAALGETPEYVMRNADPSSVALNKWIDTKLTKYVKNEMATPEDPIRALAERGTLHFEPRGGAVRSHTMRAAAGMQTEPTATTPLARAWEDVSDAAVMRGQYQDMIPFAESGEEGLRKYGGEYAVKNPQAVAYAFDTGALPSDMGFPHIIDELTNAMNPNSGLPASLRLTPQQLEKVTVPQAVERVAKINEWRTEQAIKAEREGMLANLQATPRLADNSLQLSFVDKPGGSWVDIPETTDPKGLALCTSIGRAGGWCTQGDYLAESYGSGEHRLTALVDAEGRPHAQAKITENEWPVSGEGFALLDPQTKAQYGRYVREWRQRNPEVEELTDDDVIQALKEAGVKGPAPDITELKPPGNAFDSKRAMEYAKRDPDYKAKVTDSVVKFLNSGEWGDVRDLHLYDIVDLKRDKRMLDAYLRDITKLPSGRAVLDKALKAQPTAPRFMTLDQFTKFLGYKNGGEVKLKPGFARGGAVELKDGGKVTFTNNPDTMRLELLRKKHA